MLTLTVTAARARLGYWLARAVRGEEIGVVVGAQIVALRSVPIQAADYLETEYGLTQAEADRAVAAIEAETQQAKAAGSLLSLEELTATLPHAPRRSRKKRQPRAGRTQTEGATRED
jgi:antitoxin (DNA-binding transcriptional repressor) of toxin-antitoxin stability system